MTQIPLKCRCGAVKGTAHGVSPRSGTRVVCYCSDCQAFAHHMDNPDEILDDCGGTDIFQLAPAQVEITQGAEQLRCLRLSEKGTHRWYTACCKTPVGNTVSTKLPFVGLIHSFMDDEGVRDRNLGPVRFHVQGKYANGDPGVKKLYPAFPPRLMVRFMGKLLMTKLRGKGKPTPFYNEVGKPVVSPQLASPK